MFHAASLAEQFHLLPSVSEALLDKCASFLRTTFKAPDDFNEFYTTYSNKEDGMIAFRLLARIDMNDIVIVPRAAKEKNIVRNLLSTVNPRKQLAHLYHFIVLSNRDDLDLDLDSVCFLSLTLSNIVKSLQRCQDMDIQQAGDLLTIETTVEDGFTHEESMALHLHCITSLMQKFNMMLTIDDAEGIWDAAMKTNLHNRSTIFSWFSAFHNDNHIAPEAYGPLRDLMSSCDVENRNVDGFQSMCVVLGLIGIQNT